MKISLDIDNKIIQNTLRSGLDACGYWAKQVESVISSEASHYPPLHTEELPFAPACGLVVTTQEEAVKGAGLKYRLARVDIEMGLVKMAALSPHHFGRMLAGKGDNETGDVFLQCALFGEVVFS